MTDPKSSTFPAIFPENSRMDFISASEYGLTKREYIAIMAMPGIQRGMRHVDGQGDETECANLCVRYADALIKALNNPEQ